MIFPSSAFEVVRLSGGQLQVIATRPYLSILPMLLIVVISTCFFMYRAIHSHTWWPLLGLVIWCLPWTIAVLMCLRGGSVTLDRAADTAQLHQPSFFWHKDATIPLHSIRYARIQSTRNGIWIALVLQDGGAVSFSDSSDQSGQREAAEAINEYLGTSIR